MIVPPRKPGEPELVKLVDFGIAKMVSVMTEDQLPSLTQTGETVGSPLYMSPVGNAAVCKSIIAPDVYSLGCLAYKSLTGFPPFLGGSDIDVYFKHINEEPPAFTAAAPDLIVQEELEAHRHPVLAEISGPSASRIDGRVAASSSMSW